MTTRVRIRAVPIEHWRDAAERLYEEKSAAWLTWKAEAVAYMALMLEADEEAEPEIVAMGQGMACGVQEYAEQRAGVA